MFQFKSEICFGPIIEFCVYKYLNAGEPYQDERGKETGGKKKDRRKPR